MSGWVGEGENQTGNSPSPLSLKTLYHSKPFIFMKIHFKVSEAIEEIDAALFSGDSFYLIENLEELERILERSEKRKNEIKTFLSEE